MLIFDLDGTISDPLPGIARALNYALERYGYPLLRQEDVAPFVGPPLDQTLLELSGGNTVLVTELVAAYRECYRESCIENTVYEGVPEVLEILRKQGRRLGVCTSKRADFAEAILHHFGLRDAFEFVSGGEIGTGKWQQLQALKAAGFLTDDAMMIGDRAVDIEAGKRNRLRTGGVLWGFGSQAELSQAGPDLIFERPADWATLL